MGADPHTLPPAPDPPEPDPPAPITPTIPTTSGEPVARFDLPLAELQTYRAELVEPADLDEFWTSSVADARAFDVDVRLERVDAGLELVEVFDVTFAGFGGHPIKGWFSRPRAADGPLPAVVQYNGYGGGRGLPFQHTQWPTAGYAHLFMDTRGQGAGWGEGGETADPVGSGAATPGSMTRGIENPEDYFYRRVFIDAVRAVDAVRAIDGEDPERVAVAGGSQGGGMTIAAAALTGGLRAAMPDVPFLSHFSRAIEITDAFPYGEIVKYLSVRRGATEQVMRTLSYFDGMHLARRASAPGLFSVALMAMVCPPSTVYAAFNRWGELNGDVAKRIEVYPFNGHEGGQAYQWVHQRAWVREHLDQ